MNGQNAFVFILKHADTVETETTVPHIHGGGLAGSVVTQQWGNMAFVEGNIKVLNGHSVTIDLAETAKCDAHWELGEILPGLRGNSALAWEKHGDKDNR